MKASEGNNQISKSRSFHNVGAACTKDLSKNELVHVLLIGMGRKWGYWRLCGTWADSGWWGEWRRRGSGANGEMGMSGADGNNGGEAGAEGVREVVGFIGDEHRLTGLIIILTMSS